MIKILAFCILILGLQISLVPLLSYPSPNLIFATILAASLVFEAFEIFLVVIFFSVTSSMLVYDSSNFWLYPFVAMIANRINPPQINNKMIVLISYCFLFTVIMEAFNPNKMNYLTNISNAIVMNLISAIVIYLLLNFSMKKKDTLKYSR